MAKDYKVWLEVESHDDETDAYNYCDLAFAGTAQFDNIDKARKFASLLDEIGNTIMTATDSPDVISASVMRFEIGNLIEQWQRGRATTPTETGFSPDSVTYDDKATDLNNGDANRRNTL